MGRFGNKRIDDLKKTNIRIARFYQNISKLPMDVESTDNIFTKQLFFDKFTVPLNENRVTKYNNLMNF